MRLVTPKPVLRRCYPALSWHLIVYFVFSPSDRPLRLAPDEIRDQTAPLHGLGWARRGPYHVTGCWGFVRQVKSKSPPNAGPLAVALQVSGDQARGKGASPLGVMEMFGNSTEALIALRGCQAPLSCTPSGGHSTFCEFHPQRGSKRKQQRGSFCLAD